jgi:hypothetical protein
MEVTLLVAAMKVSQQKDSSSRSGILLLFSDRHWRPDIQSRGIGWSSSGHSADPSHNRQRTGGDARRDGGTRPHFQDSRLMSSGGMGADPLLFGV